MRSRFACFTALLALAGCATIETADRGAPPPPASVSAPAPRAAAPVFVKSQILGRSAGAVDALLGAPALVRREGESEFRRYSLAGCSLIVILHPDETGAMTAGHLDAAARVTGEAKPDLDRCLAGGPALPTS